MKMNALKQYIDLFDNYRRDIEREAPAPLNALRQSAREMLEGARLPRKGEEDYEGTDMEAIFAPDYGVNVHRMAFDASTAESFRCDVPNMSTCLYYMSNDTFHASPTAQRNAGEVVIEPFAIAAHNHLDLLSTHYGSLANLADPTVALNTLLAQDGVFIYVPDGVVAERPIQLVNIFNAAMDVMSVRRLLIVIGKHAQARLLMCDHTQNASQRYLSNQVVEIYCYGG